MTIHIVPYDRSRHYDAVPALILGIQQGEFAVPITLEDQPDLLDVAGTYLQGRGCFLVAEAEDGTVVGTAALIDCGGGLATLRKMFVAAGHRGRESGVAQTLLEHLQAHARDNGFTEILLGTIERLGAARRFYQRNGFTPVAPEALPPAFPRMAVDTHFYRLGL